MTVLTKDLSVDQFVAGKLRQKEDKKIYNFNSEGYDLEEAASVVKTLAKKHNKTVDEVEKLWKKAKKSAADSGHKEDYAYITVILKKMLGETSLIEGILNIEENNDHRFVYDGWVYFEVGAEVNQSSYPGQPAKVIQVIEKPNGEDTLYKLEIDVRGHPEGIDEDGEPVDKKYSTVRADQLNRLNPPN